MRPRFVLAAVAELPDIVKISICVTDVYRTATVITTVVINSHKYCIRPVGRLPSPHSRQLLTQAQIVYSSTSTQGQLNT